MADGRIRASLDEGVLELVFDRPERKNALTLAMYEQLVAGLERARVDEAVRVVLLRGAGGTFTAGNDLGDFLAAPPTGPDSPLGRFLLALRDFPKPLVAAVSGYAVGIGTTLLLHCDLVYAARNATFKLPFVDLALVPEAGSSFLLPRLLGHQRASELLLLGDPFDVVKAVDAGLVTASFETEDLEREVHLRVRRLAAKPPEAVRETKRLVRGATAEAVDRAMQREAEVFLARLASPEFAEAVATFFARRGSGS